MVGNVQMKYVLFVTSREIYAVNGAAKGRADVMGWVDFDEIWRSYPEDPLAKVNIGPVIDRGLALCG